MTLTVRRVVQFPQSVDHLYLVGDLVVASDNFSAIYACNICLPNVFVSDGFVLVTFTIVLLFSPSYLKNFI